ncbi:MAG: hydrogenase subunit MbhD domain-containing protein [Deferrisomatales bacterium]|nr:hydrogenase subunit MbhD domain-containing protein [Deferrisomatales bacterium]
MNWEIEILFYVVLTTAALVALHVRNLMAAAVTLAIFSYVGALLMMSMGAVDVAFTEAVVGAGITGVFYIAMILKTSQRSSD